MATARRAGTTHQPTAPPTGAGAAPPAKEPEAAPAPTYAWPEISRRVAKPSDAVRAVFRVVRAKADLATLGAKIRSQRVLTDLLRWLGAIIDFWPTATPAQRALLLGFSDELLQVVVAEGLQLQAMLDRHEAARNRQATDLASASHAADQLITRGKVLRRAIHNVLLGAAAIDAAVSPDAVRTAGGAASDAASVALSLRALVRECRAVLARKGSQGASYLAYGRVTPALLDEAEALAAQVEAAAARSGGASVASEVTPADLNAQDGVCLTHMATLLAIFEAARTVDRTIPELRPLATRTLLGAHPKKKTKAKPAPEPAKPQG